MSNAILHSSQYQNYRRIDLIVIHCSATRATQRYTVDDCRRDHRARGFAGHNERLPMFCCIKCSRNTSMS